MEVSKKALVFICHNNGDKDIAREIGLFLVSEGVNVWYDEWVISAGDSITEQINYGLTDCTDFVILWSQNASKSNWVRRELSTTLSALITANGRPKIIPIVLDQTPLPALLRDIRYINYSDGSEVDRSNIVRRRIVCRQKHKNSPSRMAVAIPLIYRQ